MSLHTVRSRGWLPGQNAIGILINDAARVTSGRLKGRTPFFVDCSRSPPRRAARHMSGQRFSRVSAPNVTTMPDATPTMLQRHERRNTGGVAVGLERPMVLLTQLRGELSVSS